MPHLLDPAGGLFRPTGNHVGLCLGAKMNVIKSVGTFDEDMLGEPFMLSVRKVIKFRRLAGPIKNHPQLDRQGMTEAFLEETLVGQGECRLGCSR